MENVTINSSEVNLNLYAIRSKDGKWLRAKGYSGSGQAWVDDINKAKIYPKIGPARRQVTWWSNNFPKYGIPDLVKLTVTGFEILDEESRVKKSQDKKAEAEAKRNERIAKQKLEDAEKALAKAQENLSRLKN